MSIKEMYPFTFVQENSNVLHFKLENGNVHAKIFILEKDIVRILFSEGETLKLDRTWSVAPGMEDVPMEGRSRFDTEGFSLPAYETRLSEEIYIVETEILKLHIKRDGFQIRWFYRETWETLSHDDD